ncbi:MAG: GspE/PulE family protein [Tepidanaerobacteraceae bacterium]|jgi:type IV pilus assembly protein PilB
MIGLGDNKLANIFLEENILTEEQLRSALEIHRESKKSFNEILTELGFVTEKQIIDALGLKLGKPYVKLSEYSFSEKIINILPEYILKKYCVFPIKKDGNVLTIAMNDPLNSYAVDEIKILTGLDIRVMFASKKDIENAIANYYPFADSSKTGIFETKKATSTVEENNETTEGFVEAKTAPVVRLVDTIIEQAIKKGASDIHIEPQEKNLRIRYRIDGMLYEVMDFSKSMLSSISTRIKIIASMDITKKRVPQDGRIQLHFDNNDVDIRVSTLPTINGEKIVLRLLNRSNVLMDIKKLGFNSRQIDRLLDMLKFPYGMILVTGPTGSGKTTTLYSMLNIINRSTDNIVTLEDPIEYSIQGVNQVQINPKGGITFANGLRSILRQDPNIIMVGEIRDYETAEISVRAALTGHLVFSTLHTNSASGTILRLLDMGVEPYLLASCLVGVVSQRLVRKICTKCKQGRKANELEIAYLGVNDSLNIYKGKGCAACGQTGYRGRTAIGEIVRITPTHRELISKRATSQQIDKISRSCNFESLKENGIELVKNGITTIDELKRVIYQE